MSTSIDLASGSQQVNAKSQIFAASRRESPRNQKMSAAYFAGMNGSTLICQETDWPGLSVTIPVSRFPQIF